MTKYQCHGCGKVYDDEEGMPGTCCGKTLRHIYYDGQDALHEFKDDKNVKEVVE